MAMRILFLSNFYPPQNQGGYEQLCREVAHHLAGRGHQVAVLTSGDEPAGAVDGLVRVIRAMELEVEGGLAQTAARLAFGGRAASERHNIAVVEQVVGDLAPEAALVWGMWNVPRVVPAAVERLLPTAYYICDYWPALPDAYIQRLEAPARRSGGRIPKRVLSALLLPRKKARPRVNLGFRHPACVSFAVRDQLVRQGIPIRHASIIRNGIQLDDYLRIRSNPAPADGCLRLVYSGRIAPDKGIHTAVEAIRLVERAGIQVGLDIFGQGDPTYTTRLTREVQESNLPVHFHGFIPRESVPAMLAERHALIFPSEWEEPLARSVLEAMAAGLVVIGTTTGGTGEVLREGETGLTFRPGDAADLGRQIIRLAGDPHLRERLAASGQALVLREFDILSTVDQLEALLRLAIVQHEYHAA